MKNQIETDIEIIEDDDKIVSYDTKYQKSDIRDWDIDHLSLKQVLFIIENCEKDNFQIALRDKNIEFIENNNLSRNDIINELRKLTPKDYYDGPLIDLNPNRKHPVWIFKKYVRNIYCYIKLKIVNHGKIIIIISFHENN